MDLLGAANEANRQAHGLSLSLGTHIAFPPDEYRRRTLSSDLTIPNYFGNCGENTQISDEYSFMADHAFASPSSSIHRSSGYSSGSECFGFGNSRYLKPAQSLLEEIVGVGGKAVDMNNQIYGRRGGFGLSAELRAEMCNNDYQLKISKLIALLEEVEGRYEKYCNQMEGVVSSFEVIAGFGSAKSYTALAQQAMSRHFCSLRDAIVSNINLEKRKLLPKISTGLSQLSLFDREARNSRISLQQLGMIHSHRQAWRPIRGLPEISVTILRSWLFEHFLHPYPNDSEKLMLASQTGLTKNQVSNWFINARVRLWKPMIEEMYKEEFGDSSEDSNPLGSRSLTGERIIDHADD